MNPLHISSSWTCISWGFWGTTIWGFLGGLDGLGIFTGPKICGSGSSSSELNMCWNLLLTLVCSSLIFLLLGFVAAVISFICWSIIPRVLPLFTLNLPIIFCLFPCATSHLGTAVDLFLAFLLSLFVWPLCLSVSSPSFPAFPLNYFWYFLFNCLLLGLKLCLHFALIFLKFSYFFVYAIWTGSRCICFIICVTQRICTTGYLTGTSQLPTTGICYLLVCWDLVCRKNWQLCIIYIFIMALPQPKIMRLWALISSSFGLLPRTALRVLLLVNLLLNFLLWISSSETSIGTGSKNANFQNKWANRLW